MDFLPSLWPVSAKDKYTFCRYRLIQSYEDTSPCLIHPNVSDVGASFWTNINDIFCLPSTGFGRPIYIKPRGASGATLQAYGLILLPGTE
jgi:hypothetical protein